MRRLILDKGRDMQIPGSVFGYHVIDHESETVLYLAVKDRSESYFSICLCSKTSGYALALLEAAIKELDTRV